MILKMNYVGRSGAVCWRRPTRVNLSIFLTKLRARCFPMPSETLPSRSGPGVSTTAVTPQPWFEDLVAPGTGASYGYTSNTAFLADNLTSLVFNGDFGDFAQALASNSLIAPNVGMASQFAENTFFTNKGFSTYQGLLTTLQKNLTHGLQFDLNYTWAHSIDNVSIIANNGASAGYGFICDAQRMRVCRGNSDFDVTHNISSDFTYSLPFGKGRPYMGSAPCG